MTANVVPINPDLPHFTGADPGRVWPELRRLIEQAIIHAPRSIQTRIGPSELGLECQRCLAYKIAATLDDQATVPRENRDAAWLPTVGTAVHRWLDDTVQLSEQERISQDRPGRYHTEQTVTVGTIGGIDVTGSVDLFDVESGTVVDWKIVGLATLRAARSQGAKLVYQRQIQLYGKGYQDAGFHVRSVMVAHLPRNSTTLADSVMWQAPYDRQVALDTLETANLLADLIQAVGLTKALEGVPAHNGTGFSCNRFDDFPDPSSINIFGGST